MNRVLNEDIEEIVERSRGLGLQGKVFLITGATGLIGSLLTKTLIRMNEKYDTKNRLVIMTRNRERAEEEFGNAVKVVLQDEEVIEDLDYIIHLAAPTQSKFFVEKPVETLDAVVGGTKKMLELAKEKNVEKFLYVSSMEAYGTFGELKDVRESDSGEISLNAVRSSYPMGKRAAELYTYCYNKEYGINTTIARLAMCFGAGLRPDDKRVHKSFCESALAGRDIIVKSTGETVVNFVYSVDAIVALLTLLTKGGEGETYNIAGNNNGLTIYEMAQYVAGMGDVKAERMVPEGESEFAPVNRMNLSADKMIELGWQPQYDLKAALMRLMEYLKEEN